MLLLLTLIWRSERALHSRLSGCNHKQLLWLHFRKPWTIFGSTNLGFFWFIDSCSKLLPRMIVTFFRYYLRQRLKLTKLILIKPVQKGVTDFMYFLLWKVNQFIKKVINDIWHMIHSLILSIPDRTFKRHCK